jgi:hypothetical protein
MDSRHPGRVLGIEVDPPPGAEPGPAHGGGSIGVFQAAGF